MHARVRFVGHATVQIAMDGVSIITDPVLRGRVAHLGHHGPTHHHRHIETPDVVLISHIHQDHLDFPSLQKLGLRVPIVVPPGAGTLLRRRGFTEVEQLRVGETVRVGAVTLRATPANHHGFRPPFGPEAECLGFIVEGSERVYFAGDTDLFPEMESLGRIDLALLPVWGWGPTLGPGHLDPARAAEALTRIRPAAAMPIHWGTLFPLGLGRWRHGFFHAPPREFARVAQTCAPDVRVHVVEPGGWLSRNAERGPWNAE